MPSFITSCLEMLLLNTQLHMNVVALILLNKMVILKAHQFIMTPLMIILAIAHIKQMYHQLKMSEKIMQEHMVNNL